MTRDDDWAEVRDPATPAKRLAELAYKYPEFCPWIAEHPNSYEGLREWISWRSPPVQPAQDPAPPLHKRKPWRAIGSLGLALITAASIAILAVASMGKTSSNVSTLGLLTANHSSQRTIGELDGHEDKNRVDGKMDDWEIPTDAPIHAFPQNFVPEAGRSGMYRCSEEQFAWLERYALPKPVPGFGENFDIILHNEASDGGALSLGNVRFEGVEVKSAPLIAFRCFQGGKGASAGGQKMLVDIEGSAATYGEFLGIDDDDAFPEGSQVTINLDPGEVATVTLSRAENVDRLRTYEGRFVADVMDGSGDTVVLADEVVFRRQAATGVRLYFTGDPAYFFDSDYPGGTLVCSVADSADSKPTESACGPKEVAAFFHEIRNSRN